MTGITARSVAAAVITGTIVAGMVPATAMAEDPEPGEKLCDVTEPALGELSGLAAAPGGGYYAISDGSADQQTLDVFQIDDQCAVTNVLSYFNINPRDPEDLAVDANGMLWVADIGDNLAERPTAAIHQVDTAGNGMTYRFTYPDGPHDAEAMLLQPDGIPIFVSKGLGESTLYRATGPLDANNPDGGQLENVGTITIKATETPGGPSEVGGVPLGAVPSVMITGGAVSPEGDRVVLRTYTDAYEWAVTDGDIVAAINDTDPVITPLPDEPQGEAITFASDGTYVTGSEGVYGSDGSFTSPGLWKYQPVEAGSDDDDDDAAAADDAGPQRGFVDGVIDTLGINGILWVIAGIGVVGLAMFLYGGHVILRARRNRKAAEEDETPGHDDRPPGGGDPRDDGWPDSERDRYGRYEEPGYDDRRDHHRDESRGGHPDARRHPDDGLSGGRLFDPVSRDDDEFRDWPNQGPRSNRDGGTVYGRDDRDGGGTVYGGGRR
ncbi:hypothetical protein FB566_4780 [Stackebrandtia endophytica]|uniref:Uncharacterized protein n=1 Tax=Stackebrandtia endophytica TaxID=1496996 RepID=A0A543B2X6_9ACTN|nr:hypothetical protein [Stackebrandtia endophytica]TQL79179.1 hypothetical protein FB566_4780 [Stackebrandtia endophytica]